MICECLAAGGRTAWLTLEIEEKKQYWVMVMDEKHHWRCPGLAHSSGREYDEISSNTYVEDYNVTRHK